MCFHPDRLRRRRPGHAWTTGGRAPAGLGGELPARRMWSRWVAWWLVLSLALITLSFRFTTTTPGEAPSAPLIACVMMNTMLLAGWITLYVLFHADRALQRSALIFKA